MEALELFEALAPLVGPLLEEELARRDVCILATRCVLDVAEYFGVEAQPLAVRAYVYNAPFAARLAKLGPDDERDGERWLREDGSYAVGMGFPPRCGVMGGGPGSRAAALAANGWPGHLIATAGRYYGDFAIRQAERTQWGIVTGDALIGPLGENGVPRTAENETGTTVEYQLIDDDDYRAAPDWTRERRRHISGKLIRAIRRR